MNAQNAVEYGLIDEVLFTAEEEEGKEGEEA
jgi:ATP-dependent protease ClpP protease subunit